MYTFCLPVSCRERFTEALEELQTMRRDSRLPPPAVFEGLDLLGDNLIIRLVPEFQPNDVVAKISKYGTLTKYTNNGIPRYQKYIQLEDIKSYTGEYISSGLVVLIDGKLYKIPFELFNELQMKNFFNQIKEFFTISQVSNTAQHKTAFKPFETEAAYDIEIAFDFCMSAIMHSHYYSKSYAKSELLLSTADEFLQKKASPFKFTSLYKEFWQDVEKGFDSANGFETMAINLAKHIKNFGKIKEHYVPTYFALINTWAKRRVTTLQKAHLDKNGRYLVTKAYTHVLNPNLVKNYFTIDGSNKYFCITARTTTFAGSRFALNFKDGKMYSYSVIEQ